jgi:peroxidase
LLEIFPQSYIDRLKNVYEDVRDIDLYVGALLETYVSFNEIVVGPTFTCIVFKQFSDLIAGDAYYYTHRNSPYPFTSAQLAAINAYDFNNLFCSNSNLTTIPKRWTSPPNEATNPLVPCSNYPQINLAAWKGI